MNIQLWIYLFCTVYIGIENLKIGNIAFLNISKLIEYTGGLFYQTQLI